MSSINDIVNNFNVGFFSTVINTKDQSNFNVSKANELVSFKETLEVISTKSYTPPPPSPSQYATLDGFTLDKDNNEIPTKIILEGVYAQDLFLDEDGNWDVKAEAEAYKERELKYKEQVINNWIRDNGYGNLQNKAQLMKALLAKTEL